MAEIINLNKARKQRDKAEARAHAAANRVAHGRTKAQKAVSTLEVRRAKDRLDGAKLTPDDTSRD